MSLPRAARSPPFRAKLERLRRLPRRRGQKRKFTLIDKIVSVKEYKNMANSMLNLLLLFCLEDLMKKLLKKMKKQVNTTDPTDAKAALNCEHLDEIFADNHIKKDKYQGFYDDLLAWKKTI